MFAPLTVSLPLPGLYFTLLSTGGVILSWTCTLSAASALTLPLVETNGASWLNTSTLLRMRAFSIMALSFGYLALTSAATPDTKAADSDVPSACVYQFTGSSDWLHSKQSPCGVMLTIETPGAATATVFGPKPECTVNG